jgi:hypothetical protein
MPRVRIGPAVLEHLIETGAFIAALAARYARVAVLFDHFPAATFSDLAKRCT